MKVTVFSPDRTRYSKNYPQLMLVMRVEEFVNAVAIASSQPVLVSDIYAYVRSNPSPSGKHVLACDKIFFCSMEKRHKEEIQVLLTDHSEVLDRLLDIDEAIELTGGIQEFGEIA